METYLPELEDNEYLLFLIKNENYQYDECQINLNKEEDKKLSAQFIRSILPYYHKDGGEIIIYRKEYGKPAIAGTYPLWFNISHSNGVGVLLLSKSGDIGVDIEFKKKDSQILKIAQRFFHRQEMAQLELLPSGDACRQARQLWTLKESYIKAIGKGLAQPLNSFWFDLNESLVNMYLGENKQPESGWLFYMYEYQQLFDLSLCVPKEGKVKIFHVNNEKLPFSVEEIKSDTGSFQRVK
ncbi:4'-phosphopantetheinyl transferase family protein [Vibrio mangrovi]|uniref:4'-phosphopantetheinyl transferase sfp n=1 Tax=Vibrio mangrovi TaxID=474394 RepID=A0A1Y6IX10_9VIBR|nr:4'-phosphopantetheinyl transferase superfamily protein [Vibrio mangrovi]MDW6001405.1 4'-phosphopantetheinyl transferase superfamily protein [Vibrio mangrovi]SMS00573.1 4'-phosphopantetheinyl transferase sfp [Vibrio mangrovi]